MLKSGWPLGGRVCLCLDFPVVAVSGSISGLRSFVGNDLGVIIPTSNPRRGATVGRGRGLAAAGGLPVLAPLTSCMGRQSPVRGMDVESNFPLAPVSCGATSG